MRYMFPMIRRDAADARSTRDLQLPGGCILCGGDLAVRVRAGTARSWCGHCRWISRPHMHRGQDGVAVVHPPGGLA
jgi:hypothetical protein